MDKCHLFCVTELLIPWGIVLVAKLHYQFTYLKILWCYVSLECSGPPGVECFLLHAI